MGFLSKFEGKMENTVEGAADKLGGAILSPVQIAKKCEKQMRREKMVGAGKQYAPTLYTILVNPQDDERLFGYYPTLAGETETYLAAKAVEHGLVMDGQPLVRFIADDNLKHGKFEVIAEMVASPLIAQLREEEMERYGIKPKPQRAPRGRRNYQGQRRPEPAYAHDYLDDNEYVDHADMPNNYEPVPSTQPFDEGSHDAASPEANGQNLQAYIYDVTNDRAFTLTGRSMGIGRESRNDIVIPDINASRIHAEIHMEPTGAWILTDERSTNGTFVNGRQIKSTPLQDADRIIIGTTELEFQLF